MVQVPAARAAPRQARAIVTRETILEAAAHEFAAEGYHAASLSKILERSGVTKGALYFHFASKEAIAVAVYDVMAERFPGVVRAFEERRDTPDVMTLTVHLAIGIADLLADDVFSRAGMRIAAEGPVGAERTAWPYTFWEQEFRRLLARCSAEGSLRPEVDPTALARLVVGLGVGHRVVSTATTGLVDLRERAIESWEFFLDRIADPGWLTAWRAAGGMAAVPDLFVGGGP